MRDLLAHADRLMYDAKAAQSTRAYPVTLWLQDGRLVIPLSGYVMAATPT